MNYYESILVLGVPHEERYRLHCRVEGLVRDSFLGKSKSSELRHEKEVVPAYCYMTSPRDEDTSILVVRSASPIGIGTEKQKSFAFQVGQRIRLKFLCCTETNRNTAGTTRCWSGDELVENMAKPRLLKAGFDVESVKISGFDRFNVNKKEHKSWFLQGAHVDAIVIVRDPVEAEKAVVNGISKKRSFGFGLVRWFDCDE